mgnify:CR=1 FL=1
MTVSSDVAEGGDLLNTGIESSEIDIGGADSC